MAQARWSIHILGRGEQPGLPVEGEHSPLTTVYVRKVFGIDELDEATADDRLG